MKIPASRNNKSSIPSSRESPTMRSRTQHRQSLILFWKSSTDAGSHQALGLCFFELNRISRNYKLAENNVILSA